MNAIHRLVGMGGDNLVTELLGHGCPEAIRARPGHYQQLIGEVRPFPGARELVGSVHARGLVAALATSSPAEELETVLEVLPIGEFLEARTTADDVKSSKPDPDVFLAAMDLALLDPSRTLAIGDSVWDVEAARRAGIACLAVESGGFSRHELSEAGALHVYRDVEQLGDQLLTSAVARLSD
jgi:HAD superfamily hydrolase (TIGR01509 family)